MKKLKLIFSTFIFIFLFLLTGCMKKEAITSENYQTTMEAKNFTVVEATSQFSNYGYVKKALVALSSDSSYQIEFYELDNEENAKGFYDTNQKQFEENEGEMSYSRKTNIANYSKYVLVSDGYYKVVSRIDNTVVYLNVPEDKKTEVEGILEELGY